MNKTMKFFLFFLFCQFISAEKHSLKFLFTGSSGLTSFSAFEIAVELDDTAIASCDANNKSMNFYFDWVKQFVHDDRLLHDLYNQQCFVIFPDVSQARISILKSIFKRQEGIHIFQMMYSCEKDEETQNVKGVLKYGYDGEDFIALDLEALTWVALKPQAIHFKMLWDIDKERILWNKNTLTNLCPDWIKRLLIGGKNILLRTEHPSLSLLQKTPSSPVTCHATGFFPKSALMFWRKDGEEIHEDVEHGEILPNNDGTFQMRVYLNISSVSLQDWRRYDCVFQLLDKKEDILQLDEAEIRTNIEKPINRTNPIIAAVVASVLVSIAAAGGYVAFKKKANSHHPVPLSSPEREFDLSDQLNQET